MVLLIGRLHDELVSEESRVVGLLACRLQLGRVVNTCFEEGGKPLKFATLRLHFGLLNAACSLHQVLKLVRLTQIFLWLFLGRR